MQVLTILFLVCGVLSVRATPFFTDALINPVKAVEEHKPEESEPMNVTLSSIESNATLEFVQPQEAHQIDAFEATLNFGHFPPKHGQDHGHPSKLIGPIELGLRNVVASSAVAMEQLYSEMKAMSTETSLMINSNFQILTASAMDKLLTPLIKLQSELKKDQTCGEQFVAALKSILGEIESDLTYCSTNLTKIIETYKAESTETLSSISLAADDTNKLSDACEIAENFALGTFCVVNNLAEVNTRVVVDVNNMKKITTYVTDNIQKEFSTAALCYSEITTKETQKLDKLYSEFVEKCAKSVSHNV